MVGKGGATTPALDLAGEHGGSSIRSWPPSTAASSPWARGRNGDLLRRSDVVGLPFVEAADALSDAAVKRSKSGPRDFATLGALIPEPSRCPEPRAPKSHRPQPRPSRRT